MSAAVKIPVLDLYELTYEIVQDRLTVDKKAVEKAVSKKFGAEVIGNLSENERNRAYAHVELGVSLFTRELSRQLSQAKAKVQPLANLLLPPR